MFYLGNDQHCSCQNFIEVALSRRPEGPWTNVAAPLLRSPANCSWGVGQPSATSVGGKGQMLLLYTRGTNADWSVPPVAERREIDLSDAERPVIGVAVTVTNRGLVGRDGKADYLNDYDAGHNRFYAVREVHPYPTTYPGYISQNPQLVTHRSAKARGFSDNA